MERRLTCVVDPIFGENVAFDLDRIGRADLGDSWKYDGYEIVAGPVRHYYVAGIFKGRCEDVVGPAHNAATAVFLARRRVDEMVSGKQAEADVEQEEANLIPLRTSSGGG